MAERERVTSPASSTFNAAQSPYYSGNASAAATPTLTPIPGTAEIQPRGRTGRTGEAPQRVPAQSNRLTSIVDYLNADGANSSFANRKKLALEMGIRNYVGSAQQNTQLINFLRKNKNTELASARMETPSIAQLAPAVASIPTPSLSKTLLASNRKGGLIKKAQKGTKTKEGYIGNHES